MVLFSFPDLKEKQFQVMDRFETNRNRQYMSKI
jgi:hypothetical protein